jgi:FemAB-related protein (PEP-CTERM system-associated)
METRELAAVAVEGPSTPPRIDSVTIHEFQTGVGRDWDRFVLNSPQGSLFHTIAWKRAIEKTFQFKSRYAYAEQDGQVIGVLPLAFVRNWIIGRCLHSSPFAVYGGICAENPQAHDALLNYAKNLAQELQVDHVELHQRSGEVFDQFIPNTLYSTFTTELSPSNDANLKKLPKDTRYMIRKAEKSGLRTRHGLDQLDVFYSLFADSMRRLGTPVFPQALFRNLADEFPDQVDLMLVRNGDQPVTGVFSFLYRDTILPYYAGANSQAPSLAANNFMYWELMKFAVERGCRVFDFGRSKQGTGAFLFKSQWSMTLEPLKYQLHLVRRKEVPNFSPLNPKFERAARVWRKLPMGLTRAIGPRVVRWFP